MKNWLIIVKGLFPLPLLLILTFILLRCFIKHLKNRQWKPVTAQVLRIETIDPRIAKGVLGPRKYQVDLVFPWQDMDRHCSWIFPRNYNLPKVGDCLHLRYNQKKEDFQLAESSEEKRKIARLRLRLCLGIFVFLGLMAYLQNKLPYYVWWFFPVLLAILRLVWNVRRRRRLQSRIEQGELWPVAAEVQGFRDDGDGDRNAFCRIIVNSQEKEVILPNSFRKHYYIGQKITLYMDPENGEFYTNPNVRGKNDIF